jgi:hypothetical protein
MSLAPSYSVWLATGETVAKSTDAASAREDDSHFARTMKASSTPFFVHLNQGYAIPERTARQPKA